MSPEGREGVEERLLKKGYRPISEVPGAASFLLNAALGLVQIGAGKITSTDDGLTPQGTAEHNFGDGLEERWHLDGEWNDPNTSKLELELEEVETIEPDGTLVLTDEVTDHVTVND